MYKEFFQINRKKPRNSAIYRFNKIKTVFCIYTDVIAKNTVGADYKKSPPEEQSVGFLCDNFVMLFVFIAQRFKHRFHKLNGAFAGFKGGGKVRSAAHKVNGKATL